MICRVQVGPWYVCREIATKIESNEVLTIVGSLEEGTGPNSSICKACRTIQDLFGLPLDHWGSGIS